MAAALTISFSVFSFFIGAYLYFLGWTYLYYYLLHFYIPIEQISLPIHTIIVFSFPVFEEMLMGVFTHQIHFVILLVILISFLAFCFYYKKNLVYGKFKSAVHISAIIVALAICSIIVYTGYWAFNAGQIKAKQMGESWAIDLRSSYNREIQVELVNPNSFIEHPIICHSASNKREILEKNTACNDENNKVLLLVFATDNYYYFLAQITPPYDSSQNYEKESTDLIEPANIYIIPSEQIALVQASIGGVE